MTGQAAALRAQYDRWCGALHQPGSGTIWGHCGCKARQWFRCPGCGRRWGWCAGGDSPLCDVCEILGIKAPPES